MNNVESAVVGHKLNNLCARAIAGTVHANSHKMLHIHLFIGSKVAAHHPLLLYLSTVMDDYSRDIVAWKLFTSMSTDDVKQTLDLAITTSDIDIPKVRHSFLLYRLLYRQQPNYHINAIGVRVPDWVQGSLVFFADSPLLARAGIIEREPRRSAPSLSR